MEKLLPITEHNKESSESIFDFNDSGMLFNSVHGLASSIADSSPRRAKNVINFESAISKQKGNALVSKKPRRQFFCNK